MAWAYWGPVRSGLFVFKFNSQFAPLPVVEAWVVKVIPWSL